jgi:hypothetical protein
MDEKKETKTIFEIEGMRPVDPQALRAFKESMVTTVIPRVLERAEERRLKAAETRHLRLDA